MCAGLTRLWQMCVCVDVCVCACVFGTLQNVCRTGASVAALTSSHKFLSARFSLRMSGSGCFSGGN